MGVRAEEVAASPREGSSCDSAGPLGLAGFAEAAAHASSLIRFIILLPGWICSSRS